MRRLQVQMAVAALAVAMLSGSRIAVMADTTGAIWGFPPALQVSESAWEAAFNALPDEQKALLHETALASHVHRMGMPADKRSAEYVQRTLAAAGWDAQIVTYVVPIAWPTEQRLQIVAPVKADVDLYEPAIPGDRWSFDHQAIGKPYSGYSVDGDISAPLVYANYGLDDDYATLDKAGVAVRGAIVLVRAGKGLLTIKTLNAAHHGARAVLFFSDPMSDGYFHGDPYRQGPWRPVGAALRNTMTFLNAPGDPTAIGVPVPGAPHKPITAIATCRRFQKCR